MPFSPLITNHLPGDPHPVTAADSIWREPVPIHRRMLHGPPKPTDAPAPSLGDYFTRVADALSASGAQHLARAASILGRRKVAADEIDGIRIQLEKHGEFYHPARVSLVVGNDQYDCVLNVALSAAGINLAQTEYRLLRQLSRRRPSEHIPRVFAHIVTPCVEGQRWHMLLAEWFDGYDEFHLSVDPVDRRLKTRVWHPPDAGRFLDTHQTFELYARAAEILTFYFNLETFEHLSAWHHAAGDFVVRVGEGVVDVKLITVRGYRSLIGEVAASELGPQLTLETLLVFFVRLTIRMRLDRLDGIGNPAWSGGRALKATVAGFFRGLDRQPRPSVLPDSAGRCFRHYLALCSRRDLHEIALALCDRMSPGSPERGLVKRHLERHAAALYDAIQRKLAGDG